MKVGYGKLGRSMPLSPANWGTVGGDNEPPILLGRLARANPDVEFVLVGRNSGEAPASLGLPPNVTNPWTELRAPASEIARSMKDAGKRATCHALHDLTWPYFEDLDGIVLWVGQHGTSNSPIPEARNPGKLTNPQDAFIHYASYLIWGINRWRSVDPQNRREVYLCPDARNFLKARDLMWPPAPILSQYDWSKNEKHYRWGHKEPHPREWSAYWNWDEHMECWVGKHRYTYSQLEIVGIPAGLECSYDWDNRQDFGIVINEARKEVKLNRLGAMQTWVMPLKPAWVHGTWSEASAQQLGIVPTPLLWHEQWPVIQSVRATFTTPSSGSGWATTKPWECFAVGTVCFFHPNYDDQGHILPTIDDARRRTDDIAALAQFLRVETPADLEARVKQVCNDKDTWLWLVSKQRELYDAAVEEQRCMNLIMSRVRREAS